MLRERGSLRRSALLAPLFAALSVCIRVISCRNTSASWRAGRCASRMVLAALALVVVAASTRALPAQVDLVVMDNARTAPVGLQRTRQDIVRGIFIGLHEYATSPHALANISAHMVYPESDRVAHISLSATRAMQMYPNAAAVIGPSASDPSIATAEVLLPYGLPVVSPSTLDVLSDKDLYPNYFRSLVSLKAIVRATMSLLVHQSWTRGVSVVAYASSLGLESQVAMAHLASGYDVQIGTTETITKNPTPAVFQSVVEALRSSGSRVFVSFVLPPHLSTLIDTANDAGIVGPGYQWIFPVIMPQHVSVDQHVTMDGAIFVTSGPRIMNDTAPHRHFVKLYHAMPDGIYPPWLARIPDAPLEASAWYGYTMTRMLTVAINATIAAGRDAANHTALLETMRTLHVDLHDGEALYFSATQDVNAQAAYEQLGPNGNATYLGRSEGDNNTLRLTAPDEPIYLAGGLTELPSAYVPDTCFSGSDSYYRDADTGQCLLCARKEWNPPDDGLDKCLARPSDSDDVLSRDEVAYIVSGIMGSIFVTGLVSYMLYLRHERDQSKRHAKESSEFVSFIFHEARNPLSATAAHLEFLSHGLREAERRGHTCSCEECSAATEQQKADLGRAQTSMDHTVDVLNNVLDLAKLAAGKLVLEHDRVHLRQICQQSVDMMSGVNSSVPIELDVVVHADVHSKLAAHGVSDLNVIADARRIRQVLVNLLSNAVKFTSEGFVRLEAEVLPLLPEALSLSMHKCSLNPRTSRSQHSDSRESEVRLSSLQPQRLSGDQVEIALEPVLSVRTGSARPHPGIRPSCIPVQLHFSVLDTGCGISEDQKAQIFNVYESSKTHKGTGLGLALSQQFVQLMDGEITFESPWSKDRSGARFEFTISTCLLLMRSGPGVLSPISHNASGINGDKADEGTSTGGADDTAALPPDWRVLIVDDMPINIKVMKRKLSMGPFAQYKAAGWTIESASNGEEALRLIEARTEEEQFNFNLIVLDQIMFSSGGTLLGTQVAKRIRAREAELGLPRSIIIISSGNVGRSDLEGYKDADTDLCWGKPVPDVEQMHEDLLGLVYFCDG